MAIRSSSKLRRPWSVRKRLLVVLVLLVGAPVGLFAINLVRARYGDAVDMPMAEAWATADLPAIAAQEVAQEERAGDPRPTTPPPILDTLVAGWQQQTNRLYPYLIVRAVPTRDADVVVVLNPVVYRLWSASELATELHDLAQTWRVVLATSGRPWTIPAPYEPGLIVLRSRETATGYVREVVAESRDGHTVVRSVSLLEASHVAQR
jgi:hypothetical protein